MLLEISSSHVVVSAVIQSDRLSPMGSQQLCHRADRAPNCNEDA